jgi:spore coat protein H
MRYLKLFLLAVGLSPALSLAAVAAEPTAFPADHLANIHIIVSGKDYDALEPRGGNPYANGPGFDPIGALAGAINQIFSPRPAVVRQHFSQFGSQYTYVFAAIEFDGERVSDVALRYKGMASFSMARGTPKKSFKLEFDRWAGEPFRGQRTLNLNNNAMDPTQIREAVAYELFRDSGLPAGRTAFARVSITAPGKFDHHYLGLYTIVEQVDKHFLKEHFKSARGMLLKPEGMTGLPNMGDNWEQYARTYNPKSDVSPDQAKRLMDFTRLLNNSSKAAFAAQVRDYLDVDEFLLYVAVNTVSANLDSFLGVGHNYYLYLDPRDNRFRFIPWDLNLAFAGLLHADSQTQANLSLDKTWMHENPLIERVLEIPEFRAEYHRKIEHLLNTSFEPAHTTRVIDHIQAMAAQAIADETPPVHTDPVAAIVHPTTAPVRVPIGRATGGHAPTDLKAYLALRIASVRDQLSGKTTGVIIAERNNPIPTFRHAATRPATRPAARPTTRPK